MPTIQVSVTMSNGTGFGLFIKIKNDNLFFDKSGIQILDLPPQIYTATVGGHEPSSSNVVIEFIENENIVGGQSFNSPTFFAFVPFTVS